MILFLSHICIYTEMKLNTSTYIHVLLVFSISSYCIQRIVFHLIWFRLIPYFFTHFLHDVYSNMWRTYIIHLYWLLVRFNKCNTFIPFYFRRISNICFDFLKLIFVLPALSNRVCHLPAKVRIQQRSFLFIGIVQVVLAVI